MALFQAAGTAGACNVCVRAMVGFGFGPGTSNQMLPWMDQLPARVKSGDDIFRIWGLKFVLDGGAENGATEEPYSARVGSRSRSMQSRRQGWRQIQQSPACPRIDSARAPHRNVHGVLRPNVWVCGTHEAQAAKPHFPGHPEVVVAGGPIQTPDASGVGR